MPPTGAFLARHACGDVAGIEFRHRNPDRRTSSSLRPAESCYSYILLRPKDQRATAVQARLRKTDQLAAAFGARKVSVDLLGDHANMLSLTFPVVWPVQQAYSDGISSVVEEYFSSPEVQDYMCNSGFDEVRLSARGQNDRRIHPIWTARVTSEGLVKDPAPDQVSDVQLAVR